MAKYPALAAVGHAIRRLLLDARLPELATVSVELVRAKDFQKDPPSTIKEGLSIYLYRVTANTTRRNLPPRRTPTDQRLRPPLPLDLYFLLTPWADDAEKQLRLLGWAMRTLDDTCILPSGLLNAHSPETDIFDENETVELILDPLSLQDTAVLWENLKANIQPSASYVARLIALDSTVAITEQAPVQTRAFDLAKGPA